ncbi:MAG: chloride channel protein, partial [Clostridia bacterium]|nr:chloride channel protein [Clostridia bacterium]
APILGVSKDLFAPMTLPSLGVGELWLPLLVGVSVGLFATVFLKYYRLLDTLINRVTARAPRYVRLFVIFLLTLAAGLYCGEMISTGHDLFEVLTEGRAALWLLLLILAVRTTLTLSANTAGATGGIFLPLLVLGGTTAAIVAEIAVMLGMNETYYPMAVMLGVVGCVAGMMKMPLTAPVFALEALSLQGNLLPVMITAVIAFIIPELCGADSIVETIVHRKEQAHQNEESKAPAEVL